MRPGDAGSSADSASRQSLRATWLTVCSRVDGAAAVQLPMVQLLFKEGLGVQTKPVVGVAGQPLRGRTVRPC